MRKDAIEVRVVGAKTGKYYLIPYSGKLKKYTDKKVVSMFIPQIRSGRERLILVSVVEENRLIYISKDLFKTYLRFCLLVALSQTPFRRTLCCGYALFWHFSPSLGGNFLKVPRLILMGKGISYNISSRIALPLLRFLIKKKTRNVDFLRRMIYNVRKGLCNGKGVKYCGELTSIRKGEFK